MKEATVAPGRFFLGSAPIRVQEGTMYPPP